VWTKSLVDMGEGEWCGIPKELCLIDTLFDVRLTVTNNGVQNLQNELPVPFFLIKIVFRVVVPNFSLKDG